jgi:hypothetical protein
MNCHREGGGRWVDKNHSKFPFPQKYQICDTPFNFFVKTFFSCLDVVDENMPKTTEELSFLHLNIFCLGCLCSTFVADPPAVRVQGVQSKTQTLASGRETDDF